MTFPDKTNSIQIKQRPVQYTIRLLCNFHDKQPNNNIKKKINVSRGKFLKDKEVLQSMDINSEINCLMTLKDHKENFQNNPSLWQINPSKNEVGRFSRCIIKAINNEIRQKFNMNHRKNIEATKGCFKSIKEKHLHKFSIFILGTSTSSLKESLLKQSLDFDENYIKVSNEDKVIIKHARKSLLFTDQQTQIKKDIRLFDVTMGSYDGTKVCVLVGIFVFYQLSLEYNKNKPDLYRGNSLTVSKNISDEQAGKMKARFQKIFRKNDINITVNVISKLQTTQMLHSISQTANINLFINQTVRSTTSIRNQITL